MTRSAFKLGVFVLLVASVSIFGVTIAGAWTGPTAAPPNSNASAPINTSATPQTKTGVFSVTNGFTVGGDTLWVGGAGGNVGIGTTPHAWGSTWKMLQVENTAFGNVIDTIPVVIGNLYWDGAAYKYQSSGPGALYVMNDGGNAFGWYTAPSGTAGNSATVSLRMTLDTAGTLDVAGTMQAQRYYDDDANYYIDSNGDSQMNTVYANAFYYRSDRRLKENIQPLQGSLAKVLKLDGVTFNWKNGSDGGKQEIGFIAQDVEQVVPELVSTAPNTGMKAVDYSKVGPLLVNALKEQEQKIEAQQREIDDLKAQVAKLGGSQ